MSSGLIPFKADHLFAIMDDKERSFYNPALAKEMESLDSATFIYNGEVQSCFGITKYWEGRGQVWVVFNRSIKRNYIPTFRAGKRWVYGMLDKYRRIEVCVKHDFDLGRRRVELVGFKLECARAEKYLPDGTDCALYSLVRH